MARAKISITTTNINVSFIMRKNKRFSKFKERFIVNTRISGQNDLFTNIKCPIWSLNKTPKMYTVNLRYIGQRLSIINGNSLYTGISELDYFSFNRCNTIWTKTTNKETRKISLLNIFQTNSGLRFKGYTDSRQYGLEES